MTIAEEHVSYQYSIGLDLISVQIMIEKQKEKRILFRLIEYVSDVFNDNEKGYTLIC